MASWFQGKRVVIADAGVMMRPSIGKAMRAEGADLVADNRDLSMHSAAEDLMHETGRIAVLSRSSHGPRVLAVFLRDIAFRFRRWREDQQTCAALNYLITIN